MSNEQKEVNNSDTNLSLSWAALVFYVLFLFVWMWGVVLADGPWKKTLAVFVFPYGLYLVVEDIVKPDVPYTELPP